MNAAICGGGNLQDNIGKGPLIVFGVMYPQFHRRRVSWESILIHKLDVGQIPVHNTAAVCEGCQFGTGRTRQSARDRSSNWLCDRLVSYIPVEMTDVEGWWEL